MVTFIGVDPGLSGAVAAIDENGNLISVQDAPTIEVKKGKGKSKRRVYVESAMAALLEALVRAASPGAKQNVVAIEHVHAMPKNGSIGNFNLGMGFGLWLGIVAALRVPYERVEPRTWKGEFGLDADKGKSLVLASRLFPAAPLSRQKDEGRAEALLIAEWLRRKHLGKLQNVGKLHNSSPKRRNPLPAPR